MALSWNEIRDRAIHFAHKWKDETREEAEAKPFLDDFFDVFGIPRKRVAVYEQKVKLLNTKDGFIDLLWPGVLVVEMKSKGKNLESAYQQALNYVLSLPEYESPQYIMLSDFANIVLYDLEGNTKLELPLSDFPKQIKAFGFMAGYQTKTYPPEDPVNVKAVELMGKLHDQLLSIGYTGHPLKVYLVRLLFCLFADDTSIFGKSNFADIIRDRTSVDGSDLASKLAEIFQTLNTPTDKRFLTLNDDLKSFPYINGSLFEEMLPMAAFNAKMREVLLAACSLDWSKISPAIFGSMFQGVMDVEARHALGAHYTSETNILKLIKPLFLDALYEEFETLKADHNKLKEFQKKLSQLKFLDPACGCGNFLVITYRELRLLEMEVIELLYKNQMATDVSMLTMVKVEQFYGIEIEEFPARIAEVALWMTDHQMNMQLGDKLGQYFSRIPLRKLNNIHNANALQLNWNTVVAPEALSYIIGNPPFLGHHLQTVDQKADLNKTLAHIQQSGVMDFVSAWYVKAAEFIQGTNIEVAYVSTNSITQGEQVGILWDDLINRLRVKINFAHQTFKWANEAKGKAAVYCVIIGFGLNNKPKKQLFTYSDIKGEPSETEVKDINPYLIEGGPTIIRNRTNPICNVPSMMYGNKPTDDGNFLMTSEEKNKIVSEDPNIIDFIRPFLGAQEYLYNKEKWCFWLVDADPKRIREHKEIIERVNRVKEFRENSKAESTRRYKFHTLFRQITQPTADFILVPLTTSENRRYIPFGFYSKDYIVGNTCSAIPNATLFHFGVLTSAMHMAWVKYTCGRLKSDFRYSKDIVYNNFPWPKDPSQKQIEAIEQAATVVLEVREKYISQGSSLADLYDPLSMPADLVKAHSALDKAVDLSYRPQAFLNDAKRMEFLFELYEYYTSLPMFQKEKKKRKK